MRALPRDEAQTKPGDVYQELADLVWKHSADEIREALQEVQAEIQANNQTVTQVIEGKKENEPR